MNEELFSTPANRRRREHDKLKATTKPLMLLDVALMIRAQGGQVWHIEKAEHGTLFRANIGRKQIRVLVAMHSKPVLNPQRNAVPLVM